MTANILSWTRQFFDRTAAPATRSATRTAPQAQTLPTGRFIRVQRPLGRDVHCDKGSLWLTFDGDPRDVILIAGQAHRCDRNTRLIVQALDEARLRIE
jgi:hypothetical protein